MQYYAHLEHPNCDSGVLEDKEPMRKFPDVKLDSLRDFSTNPHHSEYPKTTELRMVPETLRLPSGPFVPSSTHKSGLPRCFVFLYFEREQFWGRAVRASRDSMNPGRFLFVAETTPSLRHAPNPLDSSRRQTAVRRIQDDLIS